MKISAIEKLAKWYLRYIHLKDDKRALVIALWTAATQIFETFDAFPYLVITARVKRAGKTRLSELVGFTCNMPATVSAASAASLYRMLADDKPTVIWDEAETLNSESASIVRAFLNVGYRKGQTIPRVTADGVKQWPTYCPKVFVLIGDVYDTLRDRSIVIEMERGESPERFMYERAKTEGLELHDAVRAEIAESVEKIQEAYEKLDLTFLSDRDEELWRPVFSIATALNLDVDLLTRIAADMAAEKTAPSRSHSMLHESENETRDAEYADILLRDLHAVCGKSKSISTADALKKLYEIPTAPWRKFLGTGLTADHIGAMMQRFRIGAQSKTSHGAKVIREGSRVFRGFLRADLEKAAKEFGVKL